MTRRQGFVLLIGFTLSLNTMAFTQPTLTPSPDDVACRETRYAILNYPTHMME